MEPKEKWEQLKREHKKEEKEIIEEIEETEPQIMTQEEKQKLKKQMIGMIWIIVIVTIAALVFVFGFKDKKSNDGITNDDIEIESSKPLKNGIVSVDDPTVKEINAMFTFETINPLYEENVLKVYNTETTLIENFDFSTKMLFLTSNKEFKKLLEDKGLGKNNKNVSVTTKEIDELALELFNKDINLEYQNFKYYIEKDGTVTYYDAVLKDGKYTFNETIGAESTFEVYSKMFSCYKEENLVYIESKIIFVNETGVYADPEMKKLISNRVDIAENYISKGYTVTFNYEIKNTGNIEYYFSETKTTTNDETPEYDFNYEEEVNKNEKK